MDLLFLFSDLRPGYKRSPRCGLLFICETLAGMGIFPERRKQFAATLLWTTFPKTLPVPHLLSAPVRLPVCDPKGIEISEKKPLSK